MLLYVTNIMQFCTQEPFLTSPNACRIMVMTFWMSSLVSQYSPRIHNAALWILQK